MLKLWGRANSSNVMKVIWTLEELGLAYARVDLGGPFGGTGTPDYRAMNPLGVVPTLEEPDGFTLFESNAIIRYLCNAHAVESGLYPRAARARGVVDTWLDFQQTALNRPMGVLFLGLVRTAPEKRDNAAITAAIAEAAGIWTILDGRLAKQAYVAGDALTLADIAFGVHAHRWLTLDIPGRPLLGSLSAWYGRLLALPAYKKHCAIVIT